MKRESGEGRAGKKYEVGELKGEWEVGKGEWGGGGLWLGNEGGWVQEMKV